MTPREAYEDVIEYCDVLEQSHRKREDPMGLGIKKGIQLVSSGVQKKLNNLPEEEEENVQS